MLAEGSRPTEAGLLLTNHKRHETHHPPGCKWCGKHSVIEISKFRTERDWAFGGSPKQKHDLTYHEERVIEIKHLCAHEILGLNSTEDDDVAPHSLVTKDTNTAVGIDSSKGLRDLEETNEPAPTFAHGT